MERVLAKLEAPGQKGGMARWLCLLLLPLAGMAAPGFGPPLNVTTGTVYRLSTVPQLKAALTAANDARAPATLLIADGTYVLDIPLLHLTCPGLIVRSESGNRDQVTLRGPDEGPQATLHHVFLVSASNVTIADLTFGYCRYHGVQVQGEAPHDVAGLRVRNCRIVNCNEQFIKGSSASDDPVGATDGVIENCLFEFSRGWAYQYYTGGIDIHKGVTWTVRDNLFRNLRVPNNQSNIAEHAIHFWYRCPTRPQNVVVERNWIVNCDRGIGFGLGSLRGGHHGGSSVIRNNFIYNNGEGTHTDVGIGLEYADQVRVENNTVHIASYWAPIEYRFVGSSNVVFRNNLVSSAIRRRDGAPPATLRDNLETVEPSWFRDLPRGDLHLRATATNAIDQGSPLPDFDTDIDAEKRPQGAAWDVGADEYDPGSVLVLENATCRVEVERAHGRLLRLLDRKGQVELKSPVHLAENFRLLVPLPAARRNFAHGKDQALARVGLSSNRLLLHWDGPMKDERGNAHDLAAALSIELKNQAAEFRFLLTNRTAIPISEAWYPAIGGLHEFGPAATTAKTLLSPPPHNARRFSHPFGQYLAHYPSQNMGFLDVNNPELGRGLYLGAHDPIARLKGFFFAEENAGDAHNVVAWLIHYPFTPPGGTFEGAPLVAQFHDGDWVSAGREIYRPWFIRTFGLVKPEEDWIRQHSFFQMIMILLPEGNVNYLIRQIPQLARDGLAYGLTSLQIAGWQRGGHDNGYPYYEPDPRLGTWRDLQRALRECHQLGVKVYFFVNIHVNNLNTKWYQTELKDYDFETMQGHASWIDGWGMGTLASRMKLTTPLMAFADPSFPALADAQLAYFQRLARIGADGLHIDKLFPSPLNFNPRIGLSPDQSGWEGTTRALERISRECRAIRPHFRLSLETTWDRSLSFGAATWWAGNLSVARKVFPELVETVGLYQPYDYIGVNDAVRNGHAVMVAPFHFNRSMHCEPWRGLAAYIRDVKKVRDALSDTVFTGEPLDADEAMLDPALLPAGIERATYRNPRNGKRACIITNRGATSAKITFAGFGDARGGPVRLWRPSQTPVVVATPAEVVVDGERLVFVVEE